MALTPSNMMELGTKAPDFTLPDTVSGKDFSLKELKSDIATVIVFTCNHCPFSQHIEDELVKMANDYQAKGIHVVAISANDAKNYPEDSPEKMKERAEQHTYPFPYLYDETQEVAKAYDAACTPDFYIFNKDLNCVYRGRFDDSTPGKDIPVTGKNMRAALDNILAGSPLDPDQKPSVGCNIKWKED